MAMRPATMLGLAAVTGGVVFGALGGEYSVLDHNALKRDLAIERVAAQALEAEIDSLRAVAEGLENDPRTQERVARERFGMLRDGETLYQVQFEGGNESDSDGN